MCVERPASGYSDAIGEIKRRACLSKERFFKPRSQNETMKRRNKRSRRQRSFHDQGTGPERRCLKVCSDGRFATRRDGVRVAAAQDKSK